MPRGNENERASTTSDRSQLNKWHLRRRIRYLLISAFFSWIIIPRFDSFFIKSFTNKIQEDPLTIFVSPPNYRFFFPSWCCVVNVPLDEKLHTYPSSHTSRFLSNLSVYSRLVSSNVISASNRNPERAAAAASYYCLFVSSTLVAGHPYSRRPSFCWFPADVQHPGRTWMAAARNCINSSARIYIKFVDIYRAFLVYR